jgi:hypothetical protein
MAAAQPGVVARGARHRGLDEAARRAGGFYTSGIGLQPPGWGSRAGRIDVVLTASGLDTFDREYARAREYELDGVRVAVLPLERVIASKLAANCPKDAAQMPILQATLAAQDARAKEERSLL